MFVADQSSQNWSNRSERKKDNRGDSRKTDESDHGSNNEYESDAIDFDRDYSNDVFLTDAADEEDTDERPITTHSGQAITRRSEIDFSFF